MGNLIIVQVLSQIPQNEVLKKALLNLHTKREKRMVKKNASHMLKAKRQKLETDLEKVQVQKAQLLAKERELQKAIKESKADYIVALMAESGKSIEELEEFAKTEVPHNPIENGGDTHV